MSNPLRQKKNLSNRENEKYNDDDDEKNKYVYPCEKR
jgi:hypothetical protein